MVALLVSRWGIRRRDSCARKGGLGLLLLVSQDDAGGRLLAGSSLCLGMSFLQASPGLYSGGQGRIWLARPACRNPCRSSVLCGSCGSVPSSPRLDVGRPCLVRLSRPCLVRLSRLCASLRHINWGWGLHDSSTQGCEVP